MKHCVTKPGWHEKSRDSHQGVIHNDIGSGMSMRVRIVSTASFGGDVKPSVPGDWLILAFSC